MNLIVDPKNEDSENIKIESPDIPVKVELPENSPLKRIIPPHKKVSRLVTEKDINKVIEEVKILHAICFEAYGIYKGAFAMHHAQIDNKDPLSLFVTAQHKIIINPTIIKHSNYTKDSLEGCISYAGKPRITVQRWQKIEVEYTTIMVDPNNKDKFKLSSIMKVDLSGLEAVIWQHEISHGQAIYIHSLDK